MVAADRPYHGADMRVGSALRPTPPIVNTDFTTAPGGN